MLAKDQEPHEPWGELIEPLGPISRNFDKTMWVIAFLFLCAVEAMVIHGLWFRPSSPSYGENRFLVPLFAIFPGFLGFSIQHGIGRMSKSGQISLPAAALLKSGLGVLVWITYSAMLELAGVAFS
jgi:hypothetical protein